jgi:uncharacterized membrane protein
MNMANLLLAGVSVMLVLVAIPLLLRRIPPNAFYGLRVPATYADEWVWYEANALAARDMVALGVLLVVLALVLPVLGLKGGTPPLVWAAVASVGSLVMTLVAWRRANRLLRERRQQHPKS